MFNFKLFEAGSLGRGGISEAASLGEQRWSLSAGVLGETAPALAAPTPVGVETQTRPESLVAGMEEWEEHFGFMHNVEMCVSGK
jgi:hypothetical protein